MTVVELQDQLREAQAGLASVQAQLVALGDSYDAGQIDLATDRAQNSALVATRTSIASRITSLQAQITNAQAREEADRKVAADAAAAAEATRLAAEAAAAAKTAADKAAADLAARIAAETAEEKQGDVAAQKLYAQADVLYQKLKLGQVTEGVFWAQIDEINAKLVAIKWLPWVVPAAVVVTPVTPAAAGAAVDLTNVETFMRSQGFLAPFVTHPDVAASMQGVTNDILTRAGVNTQAIAEAAHSPMDPATAATLATAVALGCVTAVGALGAVGIAAESLSLGQLETVMTAVMKVVDTMGITQLGSNASMAQWDIGVLEPARQYWLSVHQPSLPGAADLIRFVVKEAIAPERFTELMKLQGFRAEFTSAYWAAHWRDISVEQANEAYHKGIITKEERDRYLVLLDYKPEPRPGIAKADRDIIAGLAKTMLPRVDVRRGFKLGELTMEEMLKEYEGLGYEDKAPLMTKIQARAAYEGLQNAVLNEAMYMLSAGKITDADFEALFDQVRDTYDEKTLWITRAQLRKVRMAKPPAEEGPAAPSETELEEKLE